jgi:RTX calcium-binding nonapeptide repeat (4 copies)
VEIPGLGRGGLLSAVAATLLVATAGPAGAAPPSNDNFAARTTIPAVPFTEVTNTTEATREPGEPDPACGPMGRTVWYEYTHPTDTVLGASALGSDFDTLTAVWTGGSLGALTPVACSDDFSAVFRAEAGTTYLIQAGGFEGDAGTLSFRLREVDAGVITGTVTEAGTGLPLRDTCVEIDDVDLPNFNFEFTDSAGRFEVAVRPGAYVVFFSDECDRSNDHQPEWYDNARTFVEADEVVVPSKAEVSGIDAALEPACPGFGFMGGEHVIGTEGPDKMMGGPGNGVFCGFGGADLIRGGGGSDTLLGQEGRDRLSGGDGGDSLHGGNGRDRLGGGATRDRMFGDAGDDELSGGAGNDFMEGEIGSDQLSGGDDDDKLKGSKGDDALNGGPGKDVCEGFKGQDTAGPSCERTTDVP